MRKIIMLVAAAALVSASMVSPVEARSLGSHLSKHAIMKQKAVTSHNTKYSARRKR